MVFGVSSFNWEDPLRLFYDLNIYLNIFVLLGLAFLGLISWYYFAYFFLALKKHKKFEKGIAQYRFAVLVPARNEDKVIGNLLKSLNEQDYPREKFDVFVIVESKDDPTIKIVESFGFNIVIRTNLAHRRTKGFALDDAYQYIKRNNLEYDSLLIFDADNIANKDYISLMNDVKNQGYQVGVGYRNFTNATTNWVSGCSATLFSFMNQFTSNGRSNIFKKATLTGTGYYVDMNIVDDAGGWIWDGMTEDVELTHYCYNHNISMHYYNHAQYFDEQSSKYSVIHKQHVRWVWGFFANKDKYSKVDPDYKALSKTMKRLSIVEYSYSIWPFVAFCIMELIAFVFSFIIFLTSMGFAAFYSQIWNAVPTFFGFSVLFFMYIYLTFCFVALFTFAIDNKRLKFKKSKIITTTFSYMFFFADFLFAFIDGLFHKSKRTIWERIEHDGEIVDKDAIKALNGKKKKR